MHARTLSFFAGILLTSLPLAAQDAAFTWPDGMTRAQAITAYEQQLAPATAAAVSQAFAWLASHGELDLNRVEGMTAAQIIAHVRRDQQQDQAERDAASTAPVRITFPAGATQAAVSGTLPANAMRRYVLRAEAGQKLTANITPPAQDAQGNSALILIVFGKDGTVLMSDHAGSPGFSGVLPETEDYYLDVRNTTDEPREYALAVRATAPEPPAAPQKPQVPAAETAATAGGSLPWYAKPLKPGQYQWHPELAKEGPVNVIVSLSQQMGYVYRNGVLIGRTTVSTGRKGYATPTGIFHILNKDAHHHSKKYDNAPMPYSERLTWSGVALHAGITPGYPSSHGCIHLPMAFSEDLFGITHDGTMVIVTNDPVTPAGDESQNLVVMASEPAPSNPPPK